jgi:hypothetical protein
VPEPFRLAFRNAEDIEFVFEGEREGPIYRVQRRSRRGSSFGWFLRPENTSARPSVAREWDFEATSIDHLFMSGWAMYIQNTINHHYRTVVEGEVNHA